MFSYVKQSKCEHRFKIGALINYMQIFSCEHCGKVKGIDVEPVYNYPAPEPDWSDPYSPEEEEEDEDYDDE